MPAPRRLFRVRFLAVIVGFGLLGTGACGPGKDGKLVPVSGLVTVDGKPLTRGTLSFRPDQQEGNSASAEPYGEIGADGKYSLLTSKKPGAALGKYVVIISATEPMDPKDPYAPPRFLAPEKYTQADQRLLLVEVVEKAESRAYDLKLKT